MSQRHYAAVRDRIEANEILADLVSDTIKVNEDGKFTRESYIVLTGGVAEVLDDDRLAKGQDVDSDAEYVYGVRCVAVDADGARGIADLVVVQLVGARLAVEGRRCDPVRLTNAEPVEFETSVRPPLAVIDLEFTLYSRRRSGPAAPPPSPA